MVVCGASSRTRIWPFGWETESVSHVHVSGHLCRNSKIKSGALWRTLFFSVIFPFCGGAGKSEVEDEGQRILPELELLALLVQASICVPTKNKETFDKQTMF